MRFFRRKKTYDQTLPHQSGLRIMSADEENPYEPIDNYVDAKSDELAYLVMHGDDGGQIYLTSPMRFVSCNEESLKKLLAEIDSLRWNDPRTAMLYYERSKPGNGVPGGMGGGIMLDRPWVHDDLKNKYELIVDYLAGKVKTIL